jgi:hypothetical protein
MRHGPGSPQTVRALRHANGAGVDVRAQKTAGPALLQMRRDRSAQASRQHGLDRRRTAAAEVITRHFYGAHHSACGRGCVRGGVLDAIRPPPYQRRPMTNVSTRNASSAPSERERHFLLWLDFGSKTQSNCRKTSLSKKRRRRLPLHQEPCSYHAPLNQSLLMIAERVNLMPEATTCRDCLDKLHASSP